VTEILIAAAAIICGWLLRLMGHPRLIGVLFAEYAKHAVGMDALLGLRSFVGSVI